MGWPCRIISTLRVSGYSIHVVPHRTTQPCRNSRACNKLKRKYLINTLIKENNIRSFSLNRTFRFMVDIEVIFGGVIGFVAGP